MSYNPLLSIAIPTYNRANHLDFYFETHIESFKKHNIAIFISDNPSGDHASEVIAKWQGEYENIFSTKLDTMVDTDTNHEYVIKLPDTEYIWICADSYELPDATITQVLECLENAPEKYDSLHINLVNRIKDLPEKTYTDHNEFLSEIGWSISCNTTNIISRDMADNGPYGVANGSLFVVPGFIYHYLSKPDFKAKWLPSASVFTLKYPGPIKLGLRFTAFDLIFKHWPELINNLPDVYSQQSKETLILKHTHLVGWLHWRRLLGFYGDNYISEEQLEKYKEGIRTLTPKSTQFFIYFFRRVPAPICKFFSVIIEWSRRRNYRIRKKLGLETN
ncbi:glycosyltransferase [Terasakiella sp. SH-1]|uniref:glycosyltransferase n=1 Tax=Terasakiella sp. SH-1 TaxID=2560057 RepID=UPI001072ED3D|nr:glycosyltransferase [Terasakiella sp. SH-1]